MTTRKLIHMFVGVPDEILRSIGLIVVLSAQLDFKRMQLLEAADQIPVTTSADWPRRRAQRTSCLPSQRPFSHACSSRFQRGCRRETHSLTSATILCIPLGDTKLGVTESPGS